MTALALDPLPASLVARLSEEQLQFVREATRGQRLAALAAALALPEPEALTALAAAAALDIASNLETDPDAAASSPPASSTTTRSSRSNSAPPPKIRTLNSRPLTFNRSIWPPLGRPMP